MRVCYDDAQVERINPMVEAEIRKAMQRLASAFESIYDATVTAYRRASMRWGHRRHGRRPRRAGQAPRRHRRGVRTPNLTHVKSWVNRRLTNAWCAKVVYEQRTGTRHAEPGTSLYECAHRRELDGRHLDDRTAGREMQNTFRPHIAVARFAAFAAAALVGHPEWRERILIDTTHTNAALSAWWQADEFDPERLLGVDFESITAFVPQGGGEVETGHRCPGEKIAVSSLATTVAALSAPQVAIAPEGLDFDWRAMPTRPEGGPMVRAR